MFHLSHLLRFLNQGIKSPLIFQSTYKEMTSEIMRQFQILQEYFPEYTSDEVVTVGDSPNDESLFDKSYFGISVGVANVLEYVSKLQHQPAYITQGSGGKGFCELSNHLLQAIGNLS